MGKVTDQRRLVVGPARSGKSSWAEQQFADLQAVDYVATSAPVPGDAEWDERIKLHQQRRPAHWRTIETIELAELLHSDGPPMLVDCVGVWLSRIMDEAGVWQSLPSAESRVAQRATELVAAVKDTDRQVILVTNEVGAGLVPADAGSRYYRDELGRLNAQLAAGCDSVWLAHVGIVKKWA